MTDPVPTEPTEPTDEDGLVDEPGDEIIVDAPLDEDTGDPAETGANRDPGADLDSQGVPAYAEDYLPGDPDDPGPVPEPILPSVPNPDAPIASFDWGTTAEEVRQGEPLDLRLAREEPEVGAGDGSLPDATYGDDVSAEDMVDDLDDLDVAHPAGSIVQPDQGTGSDVDSDEVGTLAERSRGDLPAEEAAIHLEPER